MLSASSPLQTTDGFLGNHLSVFETGFPSWDNFDLFSSLPLLEPEFLDTEPDVSYSGSVAKNLITVSDSLKQDFFTTEPVFSHSVSVAKNFKPGPDAVEPDIVPDEPVFSPSGSDNSNPKRKRGKNSSSSSEPDPEGILVIDERKRKRMISNRDSARRSRMRKQKHLENLRNQLNRLRIENRELVNRFNIATHHLQVVRTNNDQLQAESVMLRHRLWAAQQVMMVRELQNQIPLAPANFMTPINQQILL